MDAITRRLKLARIPFDQQSLKFRLVKQRKFLHPLRVFTADRGEQSLEVQERKSRKAGLPAKLPRNTSVFTKAPIRFSVSSIARPATGEPTTRSSCPV